ncbi:OprD family outer membrane porin [Sulfurimonas sp.]|uniref:OprD family outer membrane porin n=1 Tax=Sulfurimonas sp. TaxID=2022749 RepID=UPI0025FF4CEE|nr:OprD family outer membrane porin [Sulfurimonas sp.]
MRKMLKMSIACAVMMGAGAVSAQADNVDILSNVKVNGQIRARYEMVDASDAANKPNANALTNRLVLGVGADMFGTDWLSAYAEMTDVRALNNNYDDKFAGNGTETNDVVADSEQTRLTQSYIDLKYGKTKLRVGRQIINLDNQRFVGAVDWGQMPQTFDAYTLTDNTIENLNLTASYITQVNRVFNQDNTVSANAATAGKYDTRSILLNASYKVMDELKVTAYDYMIGQGTATTNGTGGSDTYGIALTGDVAVANGIKVNYRAEYAKQTDPTMENKSATGNVNVDASYYDLELGANISGILVGAQYEVLSGDGDATGKETAFATPLATLHAHNGWADMFLATPTAGLVDMNLMVGYTSKEIGTAKVIYHDYTSDVGSKDWGTELDVVYTRAIPGVNNLTGMLKYANYSADSSTKNTAFVGTNMNIDTSKFIAMLDYKFATK